MKGKSKKGAREKNLTSRYLSGGMDEDRVQSRERFSPHHKTAEQEKIVRTALLRAEEESDIDVETLPIGQVVQVHSLFCDVEHEGATYLAVVRRTLTRISKDYIVVGDRVRFRAVEPADSEKSGPSRSEATRANPTQSAEGKAGSAPPDLVGRKDFREAVIEQVLPRKSVLTRSDSFKAIEQHPIVANAEQMLIVASLRQPRVKWGLIDRMIVAAQCGNLKPIVCFNKIDLIPAEEADARDVVEAREALAHYESMGIAVLRASATTGQGIDTLADVLRGRETALAGHSGVGKSSLINTIQPGLKLRTNPISGFNDKGRHTTTSARRYPLEFGGAVIDTPGVKLFGLWGVTRETLSNYFPDITAGNAPSWRQESYERIADSLPAEASW